MKRRLRNLYLILKFIFTGQKPITQEAYTKKYLKKYIKSKKKLGYSLGQHYKKAPSIN